MAKGIPLMGRDPDGKAKMINVDENGNVKVQPSGTIGPFGGRPLRRVRAVSLSPTGEQPEIVYRVDKPSIIDVLEFGVISNAGLQHIQMDIYSKASGSDPYIGTIELEGAIWARLTSTQQLGEIGGGAIVPNTGENIVKNASPLFDVVIYNTEKQHYKFRLKNPCMFPNGFMVQMTNASDTSHRYYLSLHGREFS